MNSLYLFPILISTAVLVVIYLMKKDEPDPSKRPNYPILFVILLVLSGGIVYVFGNQDDTINIVMKEIHTGDPNF
jgi:hypothetical protein